MACASTVAAVVPSPALSAVFLATSLTILAPMDWKGSGGSTLLGDRHAVLGHVRVAVRLLDDDVAPGGAHRALDRVGQAIHALLHLEQGGVVEHQ
jgi:hypothetical protein